MPVPERNREIMSAMLGKKRDITDNPYAALFSPQATMELEEHNRKRLGRKYPRAEASGEMALQGAKTGFQVGGGWGAVIGAVAGGTAGYFLSKPRDRRTSWQ